tara:strand:- start:55 stop:396 length:342 start_codon:yes stop_codon:yes gene_type:complete
MASEIRTRAAELIRADGITRQAFAEQTGFSEDQFQYWFGNGGRQGTPSFRQGVVIFRAFDWSPSWVLLGLGPKRGSDLEQLTTVAMAAEMAVDNNSMLKQMLTLLDPAQKTKD